MQTFYSPSTLLTEAAAKHGDRTLFYIPNYGSDPTTWSTVTYEKFLVDVETAARYWSNAFQKQGLQVESVIAFWVKGLAYLDVVHLWGMSRAGYVPLCISHRMADPAIVKSLLHSSQSAGLVAEPSLEALLADLELPTFSAIDVTNDRGKFDQLPSPPLRTNPKADNFAFINHSSGTTSGRPKLVPMTIEFYNGSLQKMESLFDLAVNPTTPQVQATSIVGGSLCLAPSTLLISSYIQLGGAIVVPTSVPYSSSEFQRMLSQCNLTALNIYSSFFDLLLQDARKDAKVLAALRKIEYIPYAGLALDLQSERWAFEQGLKLGPIFACTEAGLILPASQPFELCERGPVFTSFRQSKIDFRPLPGEAKDSTQNLLELVVLRDSIDCPHPSLTDPDTGDFHTGDLFVQEGPGKYSSAGRVNDFIKLDIAIRCDTRRLEQEIKETCDDLVDRAIVIGTGRPRPVLIVEPADSTSSGEADLKRAVLDRLKDFMAERFVHERIDEQNMLVVARGGIPRVTTAKGSLQRVPIEQAFKEQLDKMFAA